MDLCFLLRRGAHFGVGLEERMKRTTHFLWEEFPILTHAHLGLSKAKDLTPIIPSSMGNPKTRHTPIDAKRYIGHKRVCPALNASNLCALTFQVVTCSWNC